MEGGNFREAIILFEALLQFSCKSSFIAEWHDLSADWLCEWDPLQTLLWQENWYCNKIICVLNLFAKCIMESGNFREAIILDMFRVVVKLEGLALLRVDNFKGIYK